MDTSSGNALYVAHLMCNVKTDGASRKDERMRGHRRRKAKDQIDSASDERFRRMMHEIADDVPVDMVKGILE